IYWIRRYSTGGTRQSDFIPLWGDASFCFLTACPAHRTQGLKSSDPIVVHHDLFKTRERAERGKVTNCVVREIEPAKPNQPLDAFQ
ncbi:MAG: hypothetical protein AAFQ82_12445, partial [Myxococcota bacterium]